MRNNKRKLSAIITLSLVFVLALLSLTLVACKTSSESYKITFSTENVLYGSVSGSCKSGDMVEEGAGVTLTATPKDDGYEFKGWYQDGQLKSEANPYTFTVEKEVSLVAKFGELWHHHAYTEEVSYSKFEDLDSEEFVVYRSAECGCGETQKVEFNDYTLVEDTPSLRTALIRTGVKDRLIVLDNVWAFGFLEINDLEHFDESLTIMGKSGSMISGMMINSGKGSNNADANTDVMPSGITITGIEFSADLHVVNCSMDKLTISNCTFVDGAGINVRANSWDGLDENSARPLGQRNTISNTTIENCTFSMYANKTNKTKINLFDIDGATIKNNSISGCDYNAIQINSRSNGGVYGHIVIEGNEISDTYSRAIRITNIKDNITIKNNTFEAIDNSGNDNGQIFKANSTSETTVIVFEGNVLEGSPIEVDDPKVVWEHDVLEN